MNFNNTVVIMRGVSGSGKDTWINKNVSVPAMRVCSADKYFIVDGEYCFDPTKLPKAHASCRTEFLKMLEQHNSSPIIVNNTNTKCWEWENYARSALMSGYNVLVVELVCTTINQVRVCHRRNEHRVPAYVVCKAAMDFEPANKCCPENLLSRIRVQTIEISQNR